MATPLVAVVSHAESWDDDNDFDWSETPSAPVDLSSASGINAAKATGGSALQARSASPSHPRFGDDDDLEEGFGDFEDEEVDTLKVSDLSKETLAQLAAYANKNIPMETAQISQRDDASLPPLVHRLGPRSGLPMQIGAFDNDWDEDLEISDTLSIDLLKPRRFATFQSDGDFDAPSVASTSGSSTSGSLRSSSGPLAVPSHRRTVYGAMRSPHSSASSSAHLSPVAAHRPQTDELDDDIDESEFVFTDNVQMLQLGPQIVRQPSQDLSDAGKSRQRNAMWGVDDAEDDSLAVIRGSRHKSAQHSISSARSSEKSSEWERRNSEAQEDYDDFDFSSIAPPTNMESEEITTSEPAASFAERLRARLDARKASEKEVPDGSLRGGATLENDVVSGLVITDDMDLSPSRLRARSLSDRLREAGRSRRRRQEAKRKIGTEAQRGDIVADTPPGGGKNSDPRPPNQVGSNALEGQLRFPSGRQSAAATEGRARVLSAQSKAGASSSRQMSGEEGRAAQIACEQRQGGSRPQALVIRSNANNGRVTPHQAGSMSYALPTAASLARRSPLSPRNESWHDGLPALPSPPSIPTAHKFMRQPRKARNYGDGQELDRIEDLSANETLQHGASQRGEVAEKQSALRRGQETNPIRGTSSSGNVASEVNAAPASISSRRGGGRSRRKKLPFLIRNLGGPARSAKTVGEMRWNPTLKCWEGNEKEGREFEVAIRGTGRPALITPLALNSSVDSNMPLAPMSPAPLPVSRSLSSSMLSPGLRPRAAGGAQVVGDMMFDPVKMCWVRQDGEEEMDPFEAHDEDEDGVEAELPSENYQQRQIRQRSVSAELMPASMHALRAQRSTDQIDGGHNRGAKMGHFGIPLDLAPTEVEQMIAKDVAKSARQVPSALRNVIPLPIWTATIEAQQRHKRQMTGFLPSGTSVRNQRGAVRAATKNRRGKAALATSSGAEHAGRSAAMSHLYFIRDRSL